PRLWRDRAGDGLDAAEGEERDPPRALADARPGPPVPAGWAMSACPSNDELEEVALGSGRPEPRAHAAGCPDCAARVAWLRKEEEIVSRWAAQDGAPTTHLWEGVRRGIAAQRRRRRTAAAGFAAAIAAGVLV